MKKLKGAEIIIQALLNEGIEEVFGYPGGAILPFYDALAKQEQLKHILVRHEQAAAHGAQGYSRSTGKVGVMTVTSGPGATNTITGLADAFLDSTPVICISGQVPSGIIGSDGFQEADVTGLTRSCTKYNYLVKNTDDLGYIMHEAFHIAKTGRPGPVLIDIPKDMQNNLGKYEGKIKINRPSYNVTTKTNKTVDLSRVDQAINLMQKAKKPIFYVGGGVINSGVKASKFLFDLAKETAFPVTGTLMALGAYPQSDEQFLGMLGMHGTLEANMAMHECDLMINIGARFDDRVTGKVDAFSPNSKKIHVDIDASSINKIIPVDVSINCDATSALKALLEAWQAKKIKDNQKNIATWWKKIATWQAKDSLGYQKSEDSIKPQYALQILSNLTQKINPFVTTDVGQHQMWAAQHIQFNKPRRWITSGGLGTMGYGVPSAIGAQIANPKDLVICVSGEASFMMNLQELSTIKQYNLPVKILILNNSYMGMVRQWQELVYENRESQSYMQSLPDFEKLAESFGVKPMRCENPHELESKLQEMLDHDGPVLFNCIVDRAANVFPMIPGGAPHNEILLDDGVCKKDTKMDGNLV